MSIQTVLTSPDVAGNIICVPLRGRKSKSPHNSPLHTQRCCCDITSWGLCTRDHARDMHVSGLVVCVTWWWTLFLWTHAKTHKGGREFTTCSTTMDRLWGGSHSVGTAAIDIGYRTLKPKVNQTLSNNHRLYHRLLVLPTHCWSNIRNLRVTLIPSVWVSTTAAQPCTKGPFVQRSISVFQPDLNVSW